MPLTIEAIEKGISNTKLTLRNQGIQSNDIPMLCDYLGQHPEIKKLDLCNNSIGDAGAERLSATNLEGMDLSNNQISHLGAAALAKSLSLQKLIMGNNFIGDEGAKAFKNNNNLILLGLSGNKITSTGAAALAELTTVRTLDLSNNIIRDIGFAAFARNTSITELHVSRCEIDPWGVFDFLKANQTVVSLQISENRLGDSGVAALLATEHIKKLDVRINLCSDKGREFIQTGNPEKLANMITFVPSLRRLALFAVKRNHISLEGATEQVKRYAASFQFDFF